MLEKRMLIGQVQQREVGGRIDVTEAEEKAYYDAHLAEFATTPSVTLARDPGDRADRPEGRERRGARRGAEESRGDSRARREGRGVRESRRRTVGRAVEGQRRADRTHSEDGARRGTGEDAGSDESRRGHAGRSRAERLRNS